MNTHSRVFKCYKVSFKIIAWLLIEKCFVYTLFCNTDLFKFLYKCNESTLKRLKSKVFNLFKLTTFICAMVSTVWKSFIKIKLLSLSTITFRNTFRNYCYYILTNLFLFFFVSKQY